MFECAGWLGIGLIVGALAYLFFSLYTLLKGRGVDVREEDYYDDLWEENEQISETDR